MLLWGQQNFNSCKILISDTPNQSTIMCEYVSAFRWDALPHRFGIGSRSYVHQVCILNFHERRCSSASCGHVCACVCQGCHNLLTINPKKHTPNPEIIMENTAPYGNRRLKNPNLHMLMKQNWCSKILILGQNPNLWQHWCVCVQQY